ncbi:glycosyltransferase [Gallalistipes aquisgranensis]|uniref:glycosyltransferase n=1 Tax=Gallalistipes aquisgranensis TaxID=2779358 RepID=UPI001CF895A9|nr:glycosyltransferase [Gallalistipes aquisgranensis]MBE5033520.1 glycosyltransferase [Gallalistipes aquisgranensis]
MLLSIIVPLYNTEKYIVKCLRSAADQDIPAEDYEIIVVDDGSTDRSGALVREMTAEHRNIILIPQPNAGIGTARNTGLAQARGRYILFLDSDDYLEPNTLGGLLRIMEEERLEVLCLNFDRVTPEGTLLEKDPYLVRAEQNPTGRMRGRDFLLADRYVVMVYCYIYRRDLLERHSLRMVRTLHEDEEFTPRALFLAQSIRYVPKVVYHYVAREGSCTHSVRFRNRIERLMTMKSLSDFVTEKVEAGDPEAAALLRAKIGYFVRSVFQESRGNRKELLALLRYCRESGLEPLSSPLSGHKRFLYRHCMPLFLAYCRYRKKL